VARCGRGCERGGLEEIGAYAKPKKKEFSFFAVVEAVYGSPPAISSSRPSSSLAMKPPMTSTAGPSAAGMVMTKPLSRWTKEIEKCAGSSTSVRLGKWRMAWAKKAAVTTPPSVLRLAARAETDLRWKMNATRDSSSRRASWSMATRGAERASDCATRYASSLHRVKPRRKASRGLRYRV